MATSATKTKPPVRVEFSTTKEDRKHIRAIWHRAAAIWIKNDVALPDRMSFDMDLSACHSNGCPMDFKKLAEADDFNLMHDVVGIMNCIDRSTGKLTNCFLPRCSK